MTQIKASQQTKHLNTILSNQQRKTIAKTYQKTPQ